MHIVIGLTVAAGLLFIAVELHVSIRADRAELARRSDPSKNIVWGFLS